MATTTGPAAEPGHKRRQIEFTVDGEPVTTTEDHVTPNKILRLAGINPATSYLVKVDGRRQESYQGRGDEAIRVHEHEVFVSVSTRPTPTS
jgi:hypothetical protein